MTNAVAIAQQGSNNTTFRNRIINGAMTFDQRNAGASFTQTTSSQYTLDRWSCYGNNASKFTVQQSSTAPAGFANSVVITSSAATSVGASDQYYFTQLIEGYNIADMNFGSANAKTFTFSFWVRGSVTGTYSVAFLNGNADLTYTANYTISSANTWEQKTITVAGSTSGTWLTTNGIGIYALFDLGSGSNYAQTAGSWQSANKRATSGSTQLVATSGATLYITGVQLEAGSAASPFENRLYGTELALCQRYFSMSFPQGTAPANASGAGEVGANWIGVSSTELQTQTYSYPVAMRALPTMTYYSGSQPAGSQINGRWSWYSGAWRSAVAPTIGTQTFSSFSLYSGGTQQATPSFGSAYIGGGCWTASAEL